MQNFKAENCGKLACQTVANDFWGAGFPCRVIKVTYFWMWVQAGIFEVQSRRRWTWRHRLFWIPVQFNGKTNFNLKLHQYGHKECKIIWEFQIRWGGISHLKPLRRYLRYFRGTHWWSSLSRRLLAFYTWMNRITDVCTQHSVDHMVWRMAKKGCSAVMCSHVLHRLFKVLSKCKRVKNHSKRVNFSLLLEPTEGRLSSEWNSLFQRSELFHSGKRVKLLTPLEEWFSLESELSLPELQRRVKNSLFLSGFRLRKGVYKSG